MTSARILAAAAIAAGTLCACSSDDPGFVRGKHLMVATLPVTDEARVYLAAARGAFDVDNPSLLLDRRLLPRQIGLADGGRVPDQVTAELRRLGAVKGTCEPP